MTYSDDYHYLPMYSVRHGLKTEAAPQLMVLTVQIVNVVFVGIGGSGDWVLVDAGMPKSADTIIAAAEDRFGPNRPPRAIVLTHGHFDHVGAVIELIEHWDVPVFAHEQELPYLTGQQDYPPADPASSPGLVAKLSPWFPNEPIDLGHRATALPSDGTIPEMPGWEWIHTPGHTPGHVSLFRNDDRALIAGDAFVNVKQESAYDVLTQHPEISGPPKYFTTDWQAAHESVKALEKRKPHVAVTGHGVPLTGASLSSGLSLLAKEFHRIAVPARDGPVQ